MVKDRLADLGKTKVVRPGRAQSTSDEEDNGRTTKDKDRLLGEESFDFLDKFLARVTAQRERLSQCEARFKTVTQMHSKLLTEPATPELTREVNDIITTMNTELRLIVKEVKEMEQDYETKAEEMGTATARIMREQVRGMRSALVDLITKINDEQQSFKEKSKKRYIGYLHVLGQNLPDDVIEEAIEHGNLSQKITGIILAHDQSKALFEDVKARTEDLQKLEQSIRQLAEMFHDLHLLVVSQGEILNNIEVNVERSTDYAVKARKDIAAAKKSQERARWMKIGIIIGIIVLIIILAFIVKTVLCFYLPFICG